MLNKFSFGKLDHIEMLSNISKEEYFISQSSARKKVKIVVIDDELFPYKQNLESHGFQIHYRNDVQKLNDLNEYDIILLDLQGVGIAFDPTMQGAQLAKELRKLYPLKYIITYTGGASGDLTNQAKEYSDQHFSKGRPVTDWVDDLDNAIKETLSPINAWKRIRSQLLEQGVYTYQVAKLEHQIVKSIKSNGSHVDMEAKFFSIINNNVPDTVTEILKQLAIRLTVSALVSNS